MSMIKPGVATGKAIVWDASLNKWIIGDAGGGSASGVTSTNIQPTVDSEGEPLTGGQLYYDTSWNSFHGRTTDGWQELLLSNTNSSSSIESDIIKSSSPSLIISSIISIYIVTELSSVGIIKGSTSI